MLKYTKKNNTYMATPKKDIEVEVGDIKQKDFYPQVKLKKWDNEVNFSARLITDVKQKPSKKEDTISTDNIRFYNLDDSDEFPEGGYEFDVLLKSKPDTNIMTFSIQTKGLRFVYQGELTEEDIKLGAVRPDNIIGSYAVYYDGNPINVEGGKEYKAGKAFHIYRPKIKDANNNWTWGELSIDTANNLLTVTIPQEFLDMATYPVSHAAGLTVGYTTAGASNFGISVNRWYSGVVSSALVTANFDVSKLTASVFAGPRNYKGMIAEFDSATIITNGISGAVADSQNWAQHWQDIAYSVHPIIVNGTAPCLGAIGDGDWGLYFDSDVSYYFAADTSNSYASPADPTDLSYSAGYHVSIYATYTVVVSESHIMTLNKGWW